MVKLYGDVSEWCKWNDVSKSNVSDVKDVKGYQDTVQKESKVQMFEYQENHFFIACIDTRNLQTSY
jgi:hypothetical protein